MTFFEDKPNQVQYKYYDATQSAPYYQYASVYVSKGSQTTYIVPANTYVDVASQYTIKTGTDGTFLSSSKTMHNRIECCTKSDWPLWHSCSEFVGADSEA